MSEVHQCARTTPRTRAEIRESTQGVVALARQYNISRITARKWKNRDDHQDRSHRPLTLNTTLTPEQEILVIELRKTLLLPLDDLVALTHEFINADASRSGIHRCLRRHGVAHLKDLTPCTEDKEGKEAKKKTFKDYEPGFIHIDIKYLPQMPDETQRRYLFVAIDRATRWVYMHIYADQTQTSSTDFVQRLKKAAPMKIQKILTDNGTQFTDRFTSKNKTSSGQHVFDVCCATLGIEHRLSPPRHPQTNGMVERFNGRISDLVKQTHFANSQELELTLNRYLKIYNHNIPQRALKHQCPIQALQKWFEEKPQLFETQVYEQTGLDK